MMSWLLNLMDSSIAKGFLFRDSAKEIEESDADIYGEKENLARVYQLQHIFPRQLNEIRYFICTLNN